MNSVLEATGQHNLREHVSLYVLATASNLFLSIPEYIAVRTAVLSHLPVEGSTAGFISSYGIGLGLTLGFLWTLLIFQAFLAVLVLMGALRFWELVALVAVYGVGTAFFMPAFEAILPVALGGDDDHGDEPCRTVLLELAADLEAVSARR